MLPVFKDSVSHTFDNASERALNISRQCLVVKCNYELKSFITMSQFRFTLKFFDFM